MIRSSPSSANANDQRSPKKRKRTSFVTWMPKRGFFRISIDKDDYQVVETYLRAAASRRWTKGQRNTVVYEENIVGIGENDEERRVRCLDLSCETWPPNLPEEVPEEIGDLTHLTTLVLGSRNSSLPSSIGRLQNLLELNLFNTPVTSLPPSIGRLQKLEKLDLGDTELSELPPEIGNLTNLLRLDVSDSCLMSLPSFIRRLRNLREPDLSGCDAISTLPDEIGELSQLARLDLDRTTIDSLPDSIGQLQHLLELTLYKTPFLKVYQPAFYIALLKRIPSLMFLPDDVEGGQQKSCYQYTLACRRYNFRTGFGRVIRTSLNQELSSSYLKHLSLQEYTPRPLRIPHNLWPQMLANATRAFRWVEIFPIVEDYNEEAFYCIAEPDAIYRFLVDARGFFLDILSRRNENARGMTWEWWEWLEW